MSLSCKTDEKYYIAQHYNRDSSRLQSTLYGTEYYKYSSIV